MTVFLRLDTDQLAAARAAARDALQSHVETLQTSAVDLYERMIAITPETVAS